MNDITMTVKRLLVYAVTLSDRFTTLANYFEHLFGLVTYFDDPS